MEPSEREVPSEAVGVLATPVVRRNSFAPNDHLRHEIRHARGREACALCIGSQVDVLTGWVIRPGDRHLAAARRFKLLANIR